MKIMPASDLTFPLIQSFIEPYEYTCVLLASYIRKKEQHIFIITEKDCLDSQNDILGVIFFNKNFLHCIPGLFSNIQTDFSENGYQTLFDENEKTQLAQLFCDFFKDEKPKCINGESNGTDFILEQLKKLGQEAYQCNHYKLMTLEHSANIPPEALSCDDEIRRCYDDAFDDLFELQKKYIAKEVAPLGKQVSDAECSISLRQILKNQLCFALYSDEKVVSKANTNAIGWNWVQIGGVYTDPLYRKNYYAWNLVYSVCQRVQKSNKKLCLFVKEKNNPAISLYKRMGFKEKKLYQICYFN
ncbi:MAG: GNAT family N-acetyltransferase [Treponema sp.]|nr:GNAT family N-acetyltransferase [Treponema sp.]